MSISKIKKYLSSCHMIMDERILSEITTLLNDSIKEENESLANELWCLQTTYNIQRDYLKVFSALKDSSFQTAWFLLDGIDLSIRDIVNNFNINGNLCNLETIRNNVFNYQQLFPYRLFTSNVIIEKEVKCSICNSRINLRGGCNHVLGKLYMGRLCTYEVTEMELLGIDIVTNPLEKTHLLINDSSDLDFTILQTLIHNLRSPFQKWNLEIKKTCLPAYIDVSPNAMCPCGSGLEFGKCCGFIPDHFNIIEYKIHIWHAGKCKEVVFTSRPSPRKA